MELNIKVRYRKVSLPVFYFASFPLLWNDFEGKYVVENLNVMNVLHVFSINYIGILIINLINYFLVSGKNYVHYVHIYP